MWRWVARINSVIFCRSRNNTGSLKGHFYGKKLICCPVVVPVARNIRRGPVPRVGGGTSALEQLKPKRTAQERWHIAHCPHCWNPGSAADILYGLTMMDGRQRHSWLRALGRADMPERVVLDGAEYRHARTYKHDFFAATGLYESDSGRAVLKLGRAAPLFGLPMVWLGRWLTGRELAVYRALNGVEGVPACLGSWGTTGLAHVFVEGHPLQRREWVDDEFFPRLQRLLDELHRRGIAYADLEKRENILVDARGKPALIDFQIAWWWTAEGFTHGRWWQWWMPDWLGRFILHKLQAADRYHLLKHHRRHRPDCLTPEQIRISYRRGSFVEVHRRLFRPLTLVRRAILKCLTGQSRSPKQDGPAFAGHSLSTKTAGPEKHED